MGSAADTKIMETQTTSLPLFEQLDEVEDMKEKTTALPLLDQHISLIKEHSSWWLPTAGGILAVGLKFYDPLLEYIDLNSGLFRNVLESLSGEIILYSHVRYTPFLSIKILVTM